jgi:hypothetical protein
VLLFDVGIQSRIAEIGLNAEAALEVTTFNIVLRSSLAFVTLVVIVIIVTAVILLHRLGLLLLRTWHSHLVVLPLH